MKNKVSIWLDKNRGIIFSLYAMTAAFCTYTCMYAFRKPFTAAAFEGLTYWGIELKTLLIISQVLGYTVSKFLGIKYISEMTAHKRAVAIIILVVIAQLSLFAFWIVPTPLKLIFLFLNGLPLGMIWGLVFSFLEGRRNTELLGAGLSVSFIFSSGFVKSIGKYLMLEFGVSEFAMPFWTGMVFILPLILFTWMLNQLPPPSESDEELRTKRLPMNRRERIAFFKEFGVGIVMLTLIYMFLTAFRDLRDNYSLEILEAIGFVDNAAIFTQTETPIAFIVLAVMASIMFIKNNRKALMVNHFIVGFGILLIGASTFAFQLELISAYLWMVAVGLGSYLGYVPFNCILFDRFIATYRTVANAGFLIYIADSFGYLSSVGVLLYKNFGQEDISWYSFFVQFCYVMTVFGIILTIASLIYFSRQKQPSLETTQLSIP